MSDEFVMSFVATCMAEGLTKEATAELLQRQSVLHAGEQSPEWLEGYEKVASHVTGAMCPMVRSGYFEKSAGPGAQMARAGLSALWQGTKTGLTSLAASPGVRKGVGIGAASIAGGYGVNYLGNKVWGNAPDYDVPTISPGGYGSATSDAAYKAELASKGVGIAAHNKEYFGEDGGARRRELEAGVAKRDGGAGMAQQELYDMDKKKQRATDARKSFLADSTNQSTTAKQKLAEIEAHRATMEDHKTSLMYAPYRGYLRMTGRKPDDVYNAEIVKATGRAGDVTRDMRVMDVDKQRMLHGWQGSEDAAPLSDNQMQQKFFQSYN
jgi:hypothetical protein